MELVIASANTQKVLQFRQMFKELLPKCTLMSLFDFPAYSAPAHEPSKTLQENALIKAKDAAASLNKNCLAEQWELVLPSLGPDDQPFRGSTTAIQIKEILNALIGRPDHERSACIESCVAIATSEGKERLAVGRTEGFIADSERGKGSLDYDSIFVKHDYMKTLAELSPSVRSRISSRRKALEKLIGFLESLR